MSRHSDENAGCQYKDHLFAGPTFEPFRREDRSDQFKGEDPFIDHEPNVQSSKDPFLKVAHERMYPEKKSSVKAALDTLFSKCLDKKENCKGNDLTATLEKLAENNGTGATVFTEDYKWQILVFECPVGGDALIETRFASSRFNASLRDNQLSSEVAARSEFGAA